MTPSELDAALQDSRNALLDAIGGLSEEQFRFVPAGEAWCAATHLSHLLRCERLLVERVEAALAHDQAPVASSGTRNDDDPGLAQKLAVPQIVHGLQAARRDLHQLLASRGEADLARAIQHQLLGRMTVTAMVEKAAAHEREHAPEIARLARLAPTSARLTIPLTRRP